MATISGGDRLERALMEIARQLGSGGVVAVGFLEKAKYPDGTPVAAVAAWNDYGTRTIPPRPFFRNMVAAKSREWPTAIAGLLPANNYNVRRVLELTGAAIQGQLKDSIIQTNSPPLAKSTLRKRGVDPNMVYNPKDPKTFGAKPLIHTSHMINSVDYEVTM